MQVTARWNQIHVFNYLLREVDWTEEEIKKAAQFGRKSPMVSKGLKDYSAKKFGCWFNFCLCV